MPRNGAHPSCSTSSSIPAAEPVLGTSACDFGEDRPARRTSTSGFFRSPVLALIEGQCELLFALPDDAALLGRGAIHIAHIAEALSGAAIPAVEQARLAQDAWSLAEHLGRRYAHLTTKVQPEVQRCYSAAEALADLGAAA